MYWEVGFHVKRKTTVDYDVIVVGGGHAGAEACLATARLGLSTLLVTLEKDAIVRMSCNPAIGGLAKGHLVSEIDALGGEMASIIDQTGIQFRILNRSKGRAVWSPRAQADKIEYSRVMQDRIIAQSHLEILEDCAVGIVVANHIVRAVRTEKSGIIACRALILTCGTFLNGLIHIGLEHFPGGRIDERSARGITESLAELGIVSGRLKTGTPPRIKANTIDFSKTTLQYGDQTPIPFSYRTKFFNPPNIPCYITHTNEKTHALLASGLDRSPLYTGVIRGIGPRYCPSIEDKIFRFRDRNAHQIFLEPEWLNANQIYVNGFSTSLPVDIQQKALQSISGLEGAEIIRPGYAIEYDFFPSRQLYRTLESKLIEGLYIAGQVNGTSGYEEAAALGLMAGINAANKLLGEPPFILERSEAYIGVLIDDLIVKNPEEPYRMFTSSAEYRLLLRFDNADRRLSAKGAALGLLPASYAYIAAQKSSLVQTALTYFKSTFLPPDRSNVLLSQKNQNSLVSGVSLQKLICRPEFHIDDILPVLPTELRDELTSFPGLGEQVELDLKYEGYINRHRQTIESMRKHEEFTLPPSLNYAALKSITKEAREKLHKIRPETLGQAARIPGVSPADITALMIMLTK